MPPAAPLLSLDAVRLPEPGPDGTTPPVSLELEAGRAVALSGSTLSGAVLVRACLGLASPEAGRIRLLGTDLEATPEEEVSRIREVVGAVLDPPGLVANLTIRENLLLPLLFRHAPPEEDPEDRVEALLSALELETLAERRPGSVGPGIAERVAVARALVRRPPLLFLENLDAALTAREIRTVMDLCRRDRRAILLTATETTSMACSLCDRVLDLSRAAGS